MKKFACLTFLLVVSCARESTGGDPIAPLRKGLKQVDASSHSTPYRIDTTASVSPTKFSVGHKQAVTVTARNQSKAAITTDPYINFGDDPVMNNAGIGFRAANNKDPDSGVSRMSVDACPTSFDTVKPGEVRRYTFYWTPSKDDEGKGFIIVSLPDEFKPPKPIPVVITANAEHVVGGNGG